MGINRRLKMLSLCSAVVLIVVFGCSALYGAVMTQVDSVQAGGRIKIGGGSQLGIEVGDIMVVQRSGQKVALARIINCSANSCDAEIVRSMGTVQAGDIVAYQLLSGSEAAPASSGTKPKSMDEIPLYTPQVQTAPSRAPVQAPSQLDDVIMRAKERLELSPTDTAAMRKIGDAYSQKGWYSTAIEWYKKILEVEPQGIYTDQTLFDIARSYELMKDNANARKYFQFIIDQYPGSQYAAQARDRITLPLQSTAGGPKPVVTAPAVIPREYRPLPPDTQLLGQVPYSGIYIPPAPVSAPAYPYYQAGGIAGPGLPRNLSQPRLMAPIEVAPQPIPEKQPSQPEVTEVQPTPQPEPIPEPIPEPVKKPEAPAAFLYAPDFYGPTGLIFVPEPVSRVGAAISVNVIEMDDEGLIDTGHIVSYGITFGTKEGWEVSAQKLDAENDLNGDIEVYSLKYADVIESRTQPQYKWALGAMLYRNTNDSQSTRFYGLFGTTFMDGELTLGIAQWEGDIADVKDYDSLAVLAGLRLPIARYTEFLVDFDSKDPIYLKNLSAAIRYGTPGKYTLQLGVTDITNGNDITGGLTVEF